MHSGIPRDRGADLQGVQGMSRKGEREAKLINRNCYKTVTLFHNPVCNVTNARKIETKKVFGR